MKANIHVFKDRDSLSRTAADIFIENAAGSIEKRGRFLVALSGGGTPASLYRLLASEPYREQVDWKKTVVFWGDERCVPPDDTNSNYHQAMDTLLSHVPIPSANILRVKGELEPAEAAKDYTHVLKEFANPPFQWPRFNLILLGMGEDGHTASLFPDSDVETTLPVIVASAQYQDRPSMRVSLTPAVINDAGHIIFLVTGKEKASILSKVMGDAKNPRKLPAQRIHPTDGNITWLVDEAAAAKL